MSAPKAPSVWGDYEQMAAVGEELTEAIEMYYPSPDLVDAQTPPREVAASCLPVVYRAIVEYGAFGELEALRDRVAAVLRRCDGLDRNPSAAVWLGFIDTDEVRALLAAPVPDNTQENPS